jgi:hypothetical protein
MYVYLIIFNDIIIILEFRLRTECMQHATNAKKKIYIYMYDVSLMLLSQVRIART